MTLPPLYAVVDAEVAEAHGWTLAGLAAAYLEGGARFLQLRAKPLSSSAMLAAATEVVRLAAPCGALVVVNDRADVARLAGAAGVHVGQDDLAPADVRAIVGRDALIGISTHSLEQVARAAESGADYIAVGPVFGTATKATGYEAVGLDLVRAAAATGRPVVAIGGITLERAADVITAGAASVAVISDLVAHGDPRARAAAFLARLTGRGATL